ncbi:glycogen/starch synthase, partial [candidate division WWE3 bacterium]|nr:glycogen/starch synthase [candidate division WWE3 bacterium]
MKVLQVASECIPIIKTGGLADVVGTLPKALKGLGIDTKVALPLYEDVIKGYKQSLVEVAVGTLTFSGRDHEYTVYSATLVDGDIEVYLFENAEYLSTGSIYYDETTPDRRQKSAERFAFFSRAVVDFINSDNTWTPEIVHCHDWHTGIVPHLLKESSKQLPTIFTIHNLAMQGISDLDVLSILGHDRRTPDHDIDWDAQDGNIALLLQGILSAKIITTVSPTYAKEITTPEFGEGLDKVLKDHRNKLYGILNGIDYSSWSPLTDPYIMHHYGKEDETIDFVREQKILNKVALYKELGVTGERVEMLPMVGVVSRMSGQKGFQ